MHFQWASDGRWGQHLLKWAWFMLELHHTYEQDNPMQEFHTTIHIIVPTF